jgi:phosphoribosylamine--glycine ligase
LYVGLALTSKGTRVVEFNVRFGDPETQVVLARLKTPLSALLLAAARGELADFPELEWHPQTAITVVVASENYPGTPVIGDPITGIAEANALSDVHVLHAGTKIADDTLVSSGGRVLSVVALGDDLDAARASVYAGVEQINLRGSHHRTDIALKAARGEITPANA